MFVNELSIYRLKSFESQLIKNIPKFWLKSKTLKQIMKIKRDKFSKATPLLKYFNSQKIRNSDAII